MERYPQRLISKINSTINNSTFSTLYEKNWRYGEQVDLFKHYKKQGNVVMLGNSITSKAHWNELLNRNDIINRGIGSDITEGFLARMEYIYNSNPEICFIMGGINDIAMGIKQENTINNINLITSKLIEKNIEPIVFSILYVAEKHSNHKVINRKVQSTNIELQNLCKKMNIKFVDLNKHLSFNKVLLSKYTTDGVHLTGSAYEKWGEIIKPIIEKKLN
jgi:lysophospholipase L1-like esterase